jgi:hypothetical protein
MVLVLLSNLLMLASPSHGDPALQDSLNGTMTATWNFQDPSNYSYANIDISPNRVTLENLTYNFIDTDLADFAQGELLVNVDPMSDPGNITLYDIRSAGTPRTMEINISEGSGKDTYISDDKQDSNYGADPRLMIRPDKQHRPLLQFDLWRAQDLDWVTSAFLLLKFESTNSADPRIVFVHQVNASWTEGSGIDAATGDGATWLTRDGLIPWSTLGGDFNPYVEDFVIIEEPLVEWTTWNVTRVLDQWLRGQAPNHGVILVPFYQGGDVKKWFHSKESPSKSLIPALRINYIHWEGGEAKGTFHSRVIDAGVNVNWGAISWVSDIPSDTNMTIHTRSGDCLGGWTNWSQAYSFPSGSRITSPSNRCLQYKAEMVTYNRTRRPVLQEVTVDYWSYAPKGDIDTEDFSPDNWISWGPFDSSFKVDAGTNITFWYSTDSGGSWTEVYAGEDLQSVNSQTIMFGAELTSSNSSVTPELNNITITYQFYDVLDHIHMSVPTWTGTTDEWVDLDGIGHDVYHHAVPFAAKWETDDPWGSVDTFGLYSPGLVGSWRVFCNNSDDSISNYTSVNVLPGSTLTIAVDPWDPGTLTTDDVLLFNATAFDSKGNSLGPATVDWSATGGIGTISSGPSTTALFNPTTPGTGTIVADDGNGHTNSTNLIQVIVGSTSSIGIEPWSPGTITADDSIGLTAHSYDSDGNQIGLANVTWTVNGGIGTIGPGPSETSIFDATTVGTGIITIDDGLGHTNTTDTIQVIAGSRYRIGIDPWSPGSLTADQSIDFTAYSYDLDGNQIGTATVNWTVNGGIGTANPGPSFSSTFQATTVGLGTVTIDDGMGHSNTTDTIQVIAGSIFRVGIEPWSPGTMTTDDILSFTAYAYDSDGNQIGAVAAIWSVNGGIGTINPGPSTNSLFDATTTGMGTITINDGLGHTNTTDMIMVIAGALDSIAVSPTSVILDPGEIANFKATGYDANGNEAVILSAVWLTNSGTITNWTTDGATLRAASSEVIGGWIRITADLQNDISGSSSVEVDVSSQSPSILGTIPDQERPEDYGSWTVDLTPHASDPQDSLGELKWYITGHNPSLTTASGMNVTGNHILKFTTVINAFGTDDVTLWLEDSDGFVDSQAFFVSVTSVNDKPIIQSIDEFTIHYDSPYVYDFQEYVSDIETPKGYLQLTSDDPEHISFDGLKGTFSYPEAFNGQTVNPLVTVYDEDGGNMTTALTIMISDDYVPVLTEEIPDVFLFEGQEIKDYFDLDDYFDDPDGDSLFFTSGNIHVSITINDNHTVDFRAPEDWWGTETVVFRAIDPLNARAEDIVLVTVFPINDAPIISDVPDLVVHYDDPSRPEYEYTFDLFPYVHDVDNETSELTITTSDPTHISFTPQQNTVMVIQYPESDMGRTFTVRITVSDGLSQSSQDIQIRVLDDWPPEIYKAIPDKEFDEDGGLINDFRISDYFSDPDGDGLTFTTISSNVVVQINEVTSYVTFGAVPDWFGYENVTFRATDPYGGLVEQTIRVTVHPINDAPVILAIPDQEMMKGEIRTLDLNDYVYDIDSAFSDLIIYVACGYSKTTVSIAGYMVIFNYQHEGEDVVRVEVSDGNRTTQAYFNVNVVGPPPPSIWDMIFWPWSLIIVLLLSALLGVLARGFLAKIWVDEAFLVYGNGSLIKHTVINRKMEIDEDIFSGMLTVIQEFVRDSFGRAENTQVERIDFGERKIIIERGEHSYLAIVYTGHETRRNLRPIRDALDEIEEKYSDAFEDWSGMVGEFSGVQDILRKHMGDVGEEPST